MKKRPDRVGKGFGHFTDSKTGDVLKIAISVDITEGCPRKSGSGQKAIIDFSCDSEGGIIARIKDCSTTEEDGVTTNVNLGQIERLLQCEACEDGISDAAARFGVTREWLVGVLEGVASTL